MKTVNHLLFGNHPKSGRLKSRTEVIIKIMKQNGGKIEAKELEAKLGISRFDTPSMFYKPLAALRRWDLIKTNKAVLFDEGGKKRFKTEYELTPESFYKFIQGSLAESVKKEIELA